MEFVVGYELNEFKRYYKKLATDLEWQKTFGYSPELGDLWEHILSRNPSQLIVFKEKNEIVGHAIWHPTNTKEHRKGDPREKEDTEMLEKLLGGKKDFIELHEIWLRTEHRGKGYGKRFFKFFEKFIKNKGHDSVIYYADHPAAIAICRKRGYREAYGLKYKELQGKTRTFHVFYLSTHIQHGWEDYYSTLKRLPRRFKKPAQFIVNAVPMFKHYSVKKILDLGCGVGRHCVHLANTRFEVIGTDVSKSALIMARNWLKEEGLMDVALVQAAMTHLPFRNCFFDGIISVSVIHHAVKKDIETTIKEIHRTINKNGLFLANLASVKDPRYGTGVEMEIDTFRILEAFEENRFEELHHFFTKSEVLKLFANFAETDVQLLKDKPNYWRVAAKK